MRRIDLLGAPGVGKTTLYNELLKHHNREDQWLTLEEAKILIAKRYVHYNIHSLKELVRSLMLHTINIKIVQKKISENIYCSLAKKALNEKLEEWMPFIEVCSKSLGDNNKPPYYRFLLARWLLDQLNDVALVQSAVQNDYVIFAESLAQRATGLMPWNISTVEKQSEKYFKLMPAPDVVVLLQAEPQLIIKRIIQRADQKVIIQHRDLSKVSCWKGL